MRSRAIIILAFAILTGACGGGASKEVTIDERNAAASSAVSYESGAAFVEALNAAGVACTNPTIYPVMEGGIHVADSFTCAYAEQDLVNVFVAWPELASSEYFSTYFENSQQARAEVSAQGLTLKGELWFAQASVDQRLIDIQGAIGGQLIDPGGAVSSTTDATPSGAQAIPEVCQAAREAFNDWFTSDQALFEATGNALGHSLDLNIRAGQGSSDELQLLIDGLNADLQTAQQRVDESYQLSGAYTSLFNSCLPLGANLPQACADEIGQYPGVMASRSQSKEAQTALLNASTAMRDALIAGDQGAIDAATGRVTAASDQLTASIDNWNNTVLPPFNAAIEACNAAIS
jgi:hypothetical protein